MANKTDDVVYQSREALDGELVGAVSEILSAEAEARKIVEQAEASSKAVHLDGTARERVLRETCDRECAAYRNKVIAQAKAAAEEECKKLVENATAEGDGLFKDKQPIIKKRAAELLNGIRSLGE